MGSCQKFAAHSRTSQISERGLVRHCKQAEANCGFRIPDFHSLGRHKGALNLLRFFDSGGSFRALAEREGVHALFNIKGLRCQPGKKRLIVTPTVFYRLPNLVSRSRLPGRAMAGDFDDFGEDDAKRRVASDILAIMDGAEEYPEIPPDKFTKAMASLGWLAPTISPCWRTASRALIASPFPRPLPSRMRLLLRRGAPRRASHRCTARLPDGADEPR